MTAAFAVAGVTQVYLERRIGLDFLDVQDAVAVHFWALILAACLFTLGILLFIWDFVRHGTPLRMKADTSTATDAPVAQPAK